MEAAQHIVKLGPIAVELVDRTMIELARDIALFRPTLEQFVRGTPEAILLVEFGEDDHEENLRRLRGSHELIGDLGFGWEKHRRALGRRGRGARSEAAGGDHRCAHRRPQHHDVDEGGGEAGFLRRGLRGAARASGRLYRQAHARFSRSTARAAPGMRMPRSAACTCGRCSICGSTRMSSRCAPSPRRRSTWCAATRARIPASTATASFAPSSTSRCSGRGWCARSRRSRTSSIPNACSIPARSCWRRNSTTAATFATARAIAASRSARGSTGRRSPAPAAVSRAPSRCATTTAPAAISPAA